MKRCFDFVVSLGMLIVLSPLLALLSLAICLDSGLPVLFRQERVGKGNQLFGVYKFRTMRTDAPNVAKAALQNSDAYITRVGRFLRNSSLDELPQLLNIIKGDMSIVGPRPLIPQEEEIRALRLEYGVYTVAPGITGLAQINGRDNLTDEEKALYDKEYVENQSFWYDIKILLKTVGVVFRRENMKEGGSRGTGNRD